MHRPQDWGELGVLGTHQPELYHSCCWGSCVPGNKVPRGSCVDCTWPSDALTAQPPCATSLHLHLPALFSTGPGDLNQIWALPLLRAHRVLGPWSVAALVSPVHLSHLEANGVLGSTGLLRLALYRLVLGGWPCGNCPLGFLLLFSTWTEPMEKPLEDVRVGGELGSAIFSLRDLAQVGTWTPWRPVALSRTGAQAPV